MNLITVAEAGPFTFVIILSAGWLCLVHPDTEPQAEVKVSITEIQPAGFVAHSRAVARSK